MLYRPLPTVVLEINLFFTEFQTKTWNCPVETFYVFLLHHLKVPNKGRCTLWDSWHPSTAWRSSQTVWSQHLSSQASILSMCWKALWNKRCVSFTGCLFTPNRPMLCFLSPPVSTYIGGWGRPDSKTSWELPSFVSWRAVSKGPAVTETSNSTTAKWTKSLSYRIVSSGQILQCLKSN